MEKEFNLSEKIFIENLYTEEQVIRVKDVKEFIKRSKEDIYVDKNENIVSAILKRIDKLAGDKLI